MAGWTRQNSPNCLDLLSRPHHHSERPGACCEHSRSRRRCGTLSPSVADPRDGQKRSIGSIALHCPEVPQPPVAGHGQSHSLYGGWELCVTIICHSVVFTGRRSAHSSDLPCWSAVDIADMTTLIGSSIPPSMPPLDELDDLRGDCCGWSGLRT
jgi:hypothetical protein